MIAIEIEVDGDVIRLSSSPGRPAEVIENAIVVRDQRTIVAIGTSRVEPPLSPNAVHRVLRPFDAAAFDPVLAEAATGYFAAHGKGSIPWWRWFLRRGTVRLRWPEWPLLPPNDRKAYLQATGAWADVEVNARVAARRTLIRRLLRLSPSIEAWAVAGHVP